jgi:hypothetical protein
MTSDSRTVTASGCRVELRIRHRQWILPLDLRLTDEGRLISRYSGEFVRTLTLSEPTGARPRCETKNPLLGEAGSGRTPASSCLSGYAGWG